VDTLAAAGDVALHVRPYAAYRGGRQSLQRSVSSLECVVSVDRRERATARRRALARRTLDRLLLESEVRRLLAGPFVPTRVSAEFGAVRGTVRLSAGLTATTSDGYALRPSGDVAGLPDDELGRLRARLARAACRDHAEELETLFGLISEESEEAAIRRYGRRLLWCLRKYAHRKYRLQFESSARKLERATVEDPRRFGGLAGDLALLRDQARRRFGAAPLGNGIRDR
jgi:hypothetical protein